MMMNDRLRKNRNEFHENLSNCKPVLKPGVPWQQWGWRGRWVWGRKSTKPQLWRTRFSGQCCLLHQLDWFCYVGVIVLLVLLLKKRWSFGNPNPNPNPGQISWRLGCNSFTQSGGASFCRANGMRVVFVSLLTEIFVSSYSSIFPPGNLD